MSGTDRSEQRRNSTRVVLATDAGFLAPVACVLSMLDRHDPDLVVTILHDGVERDRSRTHDAHT